MTKKIRTLFFDIETSPLVAYVWKTGKQFVGHNQIKKTSSPNIICIAYKFEGESKVTCLDWGYNEQCSKKMVEKFVAVAETADLVVGQNSDKFDIRHINTQRLLHKQDPIAWPTSEDTIKQLRKYFYLPSYSLDYVSKMLNNSGKTKMIFDDWVAIVEKTDRTAFNKMISYCKKDVLLLEKMWRGIRPHCKAKVNAAMYGDAYPACPRCASTMALKYGLYQFISGPKQKYKCKKCHHVWCGRKV